MQERLASSFEDVVAWEPPECMICYEELGRETGAGKKKKSRKKEAKLSCGHHQFHGECLNEWFELNGARICPYCQ